MNQQNKIKQITPLLSQWALQITQNNDLSFNAHSKVAGDLAAKLLNLATNLNLIQMPQLTPKASHIHLGDENSGIAFLVSSKADTNTIITQTNTFFNEYGNTYKEGIRFLLLNDTNETIQFLKEEKRLLNIHPQFNPHAHIWSFKSISDQIITLYDQERARFETILAFLKTELGVQKAPTGLLTALPVENADFILLGRFPDLNRLQERLKQKKPLLLVNGLGGVGKTELCKRFFLDHYHQYTSAAWVECQGSLAQSLLAALTKSFNLPLMENSTLLFDAVKDGLLKRGDDFLLVVDNIVDPEDLNLEWLSSLPATLLVNSRSILPGFSPSRLDILPEETCLELFYRVYKGQADDDSVRAMIKYSGGHPQTIELLAHMSNIANLTATELLDILLDNGFDLRQEVKRGVTTSWYKKRNLRPFYDHLQTLFEISPLTSLEKLVAMNLSVLPSQFIPLHWVKEMLNLESLDGVTGLLEKGWLQENKSGDNVVMHDVVRHVLRTLTQPDFNKCKDLIVALAAKLSAHIEDNPLEKIVWATWSTELLSHIFSDDPQLVDLGNKTILHYHGLGLIDEALALKEQFENIE